MAYTDWLLPDRRRISNLSACWRHQLSTLGLRPRQEEEGRSLETLLSWLMNLKSNRKTNRTAYITNRHNLDFTLEIADAKGDEMVIRCLFQCRGLHGVGVDSNSSRDYCVRCSARILFLKFSGLGMGLWTNCAGTDGGSLGNPL